MSDEHKYSTDIARLLSIPDDRHADVREYLIVLKEALVDIKSRPHADQNQEIIQAIKDAIRLLSTDEK